MPELFKVHDVGRSPINNTSGLDYPLIQAALRFDQTKTVYFNREVWTALPDSHKVGLIFHELLFAIYSKRWTELYKSGKHLIRYKNCLSITRRFVDCEVIPDSAISRTLNSYFFSRALDVSTKEILESRWKDFMTSAGVDYTYVIIPEVPHEEPRKD